MRIIGLTGSIGMGKSVLAKQFLSLGIPVHDADAVVHTLMKPKGAAFKQIAEIFPEVVIDGKINRRSLGTIIFHNEKKRKILEGIIHPLVKKSSDDFIMKNRRKRCRVCVLDIPLLFETGAQKRVHEILCVSAPAYVQSRRVLARKNMTRDKFKAIVKAQMPDYLKRLLSDHVILTHKGRRHSLNQIKKLIGNDAKHKKDSMGRTAYRIRRSGHI